MLIASDVMPASGQADMLLKNFDHLAVSLTNENLDDLSSYMSFKNQAEAKKKVTFVMSPFV